MGGLIGGADMAGGFTESLNVIGQDNAKILVQFAFSLFPALDFQDGLFGRIEHVTDINPVIPLHIGLPPN